MDNNKNYNYSSDSESEMMTSDQGYSSISNRQTKIRTNRGKIITDKAMSNKLLLDGFGEVKKKVNDIDTEVKDRNKKTEEEINKINSRIDTLRKDLTNTNTAVNQVRTDLSSLASLTKENFDKLNNKINEIAQEKAKEIIDNEIVKPEDEAEERQFKGLLGEEYYNALKKNAMLMSKENIEKAAEAALDQAIKACKITNVIYEEKKQYEERVQNRNDTIKKGEDIAKTSKELEENYEKEKEKITNQNKKNKKKLTAAMEELDQRIEIERKEIKSQADINSKDIANLKSEFLCTLDRLSSNQGYITQILEAGKLVINLCEKIHEYTKKKKAEKREKDGIKRKANELEEELIAMTTDGTKETFEKVNTTYLARYYATYYRDDISYKEAPYIPGSSPNGIFDFERYRSKGHRSYSSIPNYKEYFTDDGLLAEKMDESQFKLEIILNNIEIDTTGPSFEFENKVVPVGSNDYMQFLKKQDYLSYVKKEKREEFECKYQKYRACNKLGEFDKIEKCDDKEQTKRGLLYSLAPGLWNDGMQIATERKMDDKLWNDTQNHSKAIPQS